MLTDAPRTGPWKPERPQPIRTMIHWPHDEPPALTSTVAALTSAVPGGIAAVDDSPAASQDILYDVRMRSAAGDLALRVRCQQLELAPVAVGAGADCKCPVCDAAGEALGAAESPDGGWVAASVPGTGRYLPGMEPCRVRLLVEGYPSTPDRDPVGQYVAWVRILATAFPDVPWMLDSTTGLMLGKQELDDLLASPQLLLPERYLWVVHAVFDDAPSSPGLWLHTHGLRRFGKVDLEVLDVPPDHHSAAGLLLDAVAELLLDRPPPSPGERLAIAEGIEVSLQPWQQVVRRLPAGILGGLESRKEPPDGPHVGQSAVISAPEPGVLAGTRWRYPREQVERLRRDDQMVLYKSDASTERSARQARATWSEFAMAFFALEGARQATRPRPEVEFLVKAAFSAEGNATEHLWFRILRIAGSSAEGVLLNQPLRVPGLAEGQLVRIEQDRLSDWLVDCGNCRFGTYMIEALRRHCASRRN